MKKLFVVMLLFFSISSFAGNEKDALGMMEVVFEGNYKREQIKLSIDKAMMLYKVPITEENYNKVGSVLVSLRKENGINEMVILDYMIRSYVTGVNLKFHEAAALSVTFIGAGDR